jgi:hypothetical protein
MSATITEKKKTRITSKDAWRDAQGLIWAHRYRLALGLLLMTVNRLVGLVLPSSSKYLIDDVVIKHRSELLLTSQLRRSRPVRGLRKILPRDWQTRKPPGK